MAKKNKKPEAADISSAMESFEFTFGGEPEEVGGGQKETPRGDGDSSTSNDTKSGNDSKGGDKNEPSKNGDKPKKRSSPKKETLKKGEKENIVYEKDTLNFIELKRKVFELNENSFFDQRFGSVAIPSDTVQYLSQLKDVTRIPQGKIVAGLVDLLMTAEQGEIEVFLKEQLAFMKKRRG